MQSVEMTGSFQEKVERELLAVSSIWSDLTALDQTCFSWHSAHLGREEAGQHLDLDADLELRGVPSQLRAARASVLYDVLRTQLWFQRVPFAPDTDQVLEFGRDIQVEKVPREINYFAGDYVDLLDAVPF